MAQTTSKKHAAFVSEPMGDKPATALPGIGPVLGKRLADKGFETAAKVFGQYLMKNKDRDIFESWLKEETRATEKQASDCANGVHEWLIQNFV